MADSGPSFSPGPPVAQLCGFKVPSFSFSFGFKLPPIAFPPKIPLPKIGFGLNCQSNNPVNAANGQPNGGGRVATYDPDPDDVVNQQTSQPGS